MQIWFENLPLGVIWDDEAILAMGWNLQAICNSDVEVDIIGGLVKVTTSPIKVEVLELPEKISDEQKIDFSKTIARFLRFHSRILAKKTGIKKNLEDGLTLVFVYESGNEVCEWDTFKDLI